MTDHRARNDQLSRHSGQLLHHTHQRFLADHYRAAARGRNAKGRMKRLLCAYNCGIGRTQVKDAESWTGPSIKP